MFVLVERKQKIVIYPIKKKSNGKKLRRNSLQNILEISSFFLTLSLSLRVCMLYYLLGHFRTPIKTTATIIKTFFSRMRCFIVSVVVLQYNTHRKQIYVFVHACVSQARTRTEFSNANFCLIKTS